MHGNVVFFCDAADFGNRLNGPDFVVGMHDGDQNGRGTKGLFHIGGIYQAVFTDRQIRGFEPVCFEISADFEHRRMF